MADFQQFVYTQPVAALEGDFASSNPRFHACAGPFGLIAGAQGVIACRFGWLSDEIVDANNGPAVVNSFGTGSVGGYVARRQQALITRYLDSFSNKIQPGFMVELMTGGDVWVKNNGTTTIAPQTQCYAAYADGSTSFAAGTAASGSASTIALTTATFTGSITGNLLTVTSATPAVKLGSILSGTGGNAIATGTKVLRQLSGVAGDIGVYEVSIPEQAITSCTITQTYGLFTAGGTIVAGFSIGDILSGAGGGNAVTTGTTINGYGTGTGGAGTYYVTPPTGGDTTSSAISATTNIGTKWYSQNYAAAGEMVKISDHLLG